MKKYLIVLMIVLSPLLHAYDGYRDGYRDSRHTVERHHKVYAQVVRSEPIYKEIVTYRECRPASRRHSTRSHEGALIGGLIGGIIGSNMNRDNDARGTIGGAVAGAIIGSALTSRQERPRCKYVETKLVGYRNIAYWHGRKIVEISDRPLRRIRVKTHRR